MVDQLDPDALDRLACELESELLARSIAHTYLRMLDTRLSRATTALERRDEAAAMDVLLSLRVSSCTVGLVRLESAVLCVIDAVRRGEAERSRRCAAPCWAISPPPHAPRSGRTSFRRFPRSGADERAPRAGPTDRWGRPPGRRSRPQKPSGSSMR